MRLREKWACDRCGQEVEWPPRAPQPPHGWALVAPPGMGGTRDLCADCIAGFKCWWYEPTLEVAEKYAADNPGRTGTDVRDALVRAAGAGL